MTEPQKIEAFELSFLNGKLRFCYFELFVKIIKLSLRPFPKKIKSVPGLLNCNILVHSILEKETLTFNLTRI
jgi:hypothetical protein